MEIQPCTLTDYHQILTHLAEFWGSDRTREFHHPMFLREFGNSAFVVRDGSLVVAYLFGFLSQSEPVGYVHLVAVREGYRQRGLARRLYEHFAAFAAEKGCQALKAITTPANEDSIAFHRSLGMEMEGEQGAGEVPVVRDYSGPGGDRVVFRMPLAGPQPRQSPPVTGPPA